MLYTQYLRSFFMRFAVAFKCLMIATFVAHAAQKPQEEKPLQYVLISFDGAHDNSLWQRSRDFGSKYNAHFTYFLSCVFLMTKKDRSSYHPPRQKAGASNVGFAMNRDEVAARLDQIWKAHEEGHEIASHGCGHFDGSKWTQAEWEKEIAEFRRISADAYKNNGIDAEPAGWRDLVNKGISGFRAPYLASAEPVREALRKQGFAYQASAVTSGPQPALKSGQFMSFGLPMIAEGPSKRPVVAMDYNLYVRHSNGKEQPQRAAEFEERSYSAFRAAFDKQYAGERIPLQLGFHFVLMNDGAYWRALERFVADVCTKEDVRCVTYHDYLRLNGR